MKVKITMKNPDAVYDQVNEAVTESMDGERLSDDEREAVREIRAERAREKLGKWIEYGEYLTVEFDLDAMTARVVERE